MKFNPNFKNDLVGQIKQNPKDEEWIDLNMVIIKQT